MNKIRRYRLTTLLVIFCLVFMGYPVSADDTCVFSVTADDLPPNIVLLLDNGAEMEQIISHSGYDNTVDYTPGGSIEVVGGPPIGATGFYNDRGYGIVKQGSSYRLVDIPENLEIADYNDYLTADSSDTSAKTGTWDINGRSITLPAVPSSAVDSNGIIDNAVHFRYSKNYLNWLFFGSYDVDGAGDGSDLPNMTRFYKAKEAIMTVAKLTDYKAYFGIYYFANATGGSQAQPLKFAVKDRVDGVDNDGNNGIDDFGEILTSEFINNINNMITVTYSPLAEGLSTVGYYLSSPSSGASGGYCQQNYAIVISPGVSSEDQGTTSQHVPASLSDHDEDNTGVVEGNIVEDNTHDGINNDGDAETDEADEAVTYTIPVNQNGSTYLDDVAYYLYANDIVADVEGTGSLCFDGYSVPDPTDLSLTFNVGGTVTGGTSTATGIITAVNLNVGGASGCLELSSISGNFTDDELLTGSTGGSARVNGLLFDSGEGFQNVFTYTVGFMGDKEGDLFLINTSNNGNGNRYLYNTSDEEYKKYHFNANSPDDLAEQLMAAVNSILSRTSTFMAPVVPVTRTTSGNRIYMAFFKPNKGNFWEGNVTKYGILSNQIVDKDDHAATYDNGAMIETAEPYWATIDWADTISYADRRIYTSLNGTDLILFEDGNLTDTNLGTPARPKADIINYARGADILDEDEDHVTLENRSVITGDVLHSEPVIFQYKYDDGSYTTMVYFGANDGMLHAVLDEDTHIGGLTPGSEMWAFIPPDLLPHIKDMLEGVDHQYYVDSTPKIYFKDIDGDGIIDSGDDQVILVCGERKGGTGYFALDVTDPHITNLASPNYIKVLWRVNQNDYSATYGYRSPTHVITKLGQTWSEPQFGVVKDNFGNPIPVLFVGGGYDDSATPTTGNTVLVINVTNGDIVRQFNSSSDLVTDMNYPIPSNVLVVDENDNGFVDKVYVGDLGGQMWRIGGVTANDFDNFNENINAWTAQVLFKTDSGNSRKFFYPPSITLEKGFDMVFMGTGNREESCCNNRNNLCSFTGPDIIAAVKETHSSTTLVGVGGMDLVDVTDPAATPPDLTTDDGWYIRLVDDIDQAVGEKVLAENIVFYKTLYITTFLPNEDPCAPGGDGKLYALSYLTGQPVLDFDGDSSNDRSVTIGGGIPSKPVTLITTTGTRLLISVGSSNPDPASPSTGAGIMNITPLLPPINFFYKYWREF